MRSINVRPSNMRRGDTLDDGRIVAKACHLYGTALGSVVMFNGPAIHYEYGTDSNQPIRVHRHSWQSVKGSSLSVGDKVRAGNVVSTIASFETVGAGTPYEWTRVNLDYGHSFRLDPRQSYIAWR